MQLDEFIESILIQIASGVASANGRLTESEHPVVAIPFIMNRGNDSGQTTGIAFNVAITPKSTMRIPKP